MTNKINPPATKSILTVGDGRGFVINYRHRRLIVTAAHCLPFFPPCHGASYLEERTYQTLLAPLDSEPAVWAECLFADPIADLAVLGSPDNQELSNQADAYEALVESLDPFPITDAPEKSYAWLCSLENEWFDCTVQYNKYADGPLWLFNTEQSIKCGMSGSPIISDASAAIGIVNLGSSNNMSGPCGPPNSRLVRDLPGWLLRRMTASNLGDRRL
jgi:hypothetical protein